MLLPSLAWALPEVQEESDTVDDATITLRVQTQGIIDDPRFWCEIEIDVVGTEVGLSAGDTVTLEFTEDDFFANDVLWMMTHTITQQEADAQAYNEVFDCSSPVMADGVGDLEFFAEAEVDKALCTGLCAFDRPTTSNLDVEGLDDDEAEDDDVAMDAADSVDGVPQERIARDEDWVRITMQEPGEIQADFEYMTICGQIDAVLVDENDEMVAEIETGDDSGEVSATGLSPGVYFLQIQPQDAADFNFYDLTVDVTFTPGGTTGDSGSSGDDSAGSSGDSASDGSASDSASASGASASDSGSGASASASDGSDGSGSSGDDTESDPGAVTEDDGCGCRSQGGTVPGAWMLLGLLALRSRRRRPTPRV